MKKALTDLSNVAYLLVPEELLQVAYNATDPAIKDKYSNVPRLVGRATVVLTFQRPGPLSILRSEGKSDEDLAKVTLVADGINYPYTAGNFVSLCLGKFLDETKVEVDTYESSGQAVPRYLLGEPSGYVDAFTGKERTIPLEVLRGDKVSRGTVTGNAFNSLVFTRAKPVKSFATEGTIGMLHDRGDGNGASSAFFWVPDRSSVSPSVRSEQPALARMNTRFAAFAHVVDGAEILARLRPSDVLLSAEVVEGAWDLISNKAGTEVL
jgi:peptidylprolyl isomerase